MSKIGTYNESTGFHKTIQTIDAFVWSANFLIAIVGIICFVLMKIGVTFSLPEWVKDYNYGIKLSVNAILLLVLDNGHNRYYSIYSKHVELSALGNTIDLAIKIVIAAATILQIAVNNSIIVLATVAYLLTFLRNVVLLSNLDQEHPLREHVKTVWVPNNIRHNLTMLLFCTCFYIIEYKIIYYAASWLMNSTINIPFLRNKDFCTMHDSLIFMYVLFFDVYWIHRVLRKIKITKNYFFRMKPMIELTESMEAYNEAKGR